MRDEQGRYLYVEPPRGDLIPKATEVFGKLPTESNLVTVIFTSGGELYSKPVSREEYYNAVLFAAEGKGGAIITEVRQSIEKSTYQKWIEGAAERRTIRENALRTAARVQSAAEVAAMRKELEQTER